MKKIVTIGGGTGHYTILKGLKNYDIDLTAVVSIVDDGGSSGQLRAEFGVLPPGDLRNCLLALADDIKLKDLMELFNYRFSGNLTNHSLGNLILTALCQKYGDMAKAVKVACSLLNTSGKILPVSINNSNIYAESYEGEILKGQTQVSYPQKHTKIKRLWLEPPAFIYKETAEAIRKADLIVICPGDFYGSVLSNFLVSGVKEAIGESESKVVYICNLVTKQGTYGFKVSDFINELEKYIERKLDYIICNTKKPTKMIADKYKEEDSYFVTIDLNDERIIKDELLIELKINNLITARHNAEKVAKLIINLLN